VEQQERAALGRPQGLLGAREPIAAQPVEVDARLVVHAHVAGCPDGPHPGGPLRGTLEPRLGRCHADQASSGASPSSTGTFSRSIWYPDRRACSSTSVAKSSSVYPAPMTCATSMSVAAASGIGTPRSLPAAKPSCRSLRSSTLVNVGWKSRLTSAGD